MRIPESTPRQRAAAGNGPLEEYIEYEGDVNRDPSEYRGGSQVGYMTNVEMFEANRRHLKKCIEDVEANGCCGQRGQDGYCGYLCRMCPSVVLAMEILQRTRGLK